MPEEYLGPDAQGILVVDRDKVNQAMDPVQQGLNVLAVCWAHVRRDFLAVARSWPEQQHWARDWVGRIGERYRHHDERHPVREQAEAFTVADVRRREAVTAWGQQGEAELTDPSLHPARRKVLESWGSTGRG